LINSQFRKASSEESLAEMLRKRRKVVEDIQRHQQALNRLPHDSEEYLEEISDNLAFLR